MTTHRFASYDGTILAYHDSGTGDPLVCVPGGPGRASRYLGDLGGLSKHRTLVTLDLRGTGDSAVPDDPATYRCDRIVDDVEALREHLGLERMDLLGHSAGTTVAMLYAARFPRRLNHLVLVAPSLRAIGGQATDDQWPAVLARHATQPWYQNAQAALTAWDAGEDTPENRLGAAAFFYGTWNETVRAHAAADTEERGAEASAGYYAPGAYDPEWTRARLPDVDAQVLVITGGIDPIPTPEKAGELAKLFGDGRLAVEPDAAHYPWITQPASFVATLEGFLTPR